LLFKIGKEDMMRKFKVMYLTLIFLIIANLAMPMTSFSDTESKTIKVGYYDYTSFIEKDKDGSFSGYGVEYLEEISKYTHWDYKYVYGTWSELLDKLSNGDIDLLCTAQYTDDRSKIYDYAEYSNGVEFTTMYVSSENASVYYEDFEAFNGLKIGFLKENFQNDVFEEYAQRNDFTYEGVYFNFAGEMVEAMESGNVDAIVLGSISNQNSGRLVAKCDVHPFYYITGMGNKDIINGLNDALRKIKLEDFHYNMKLQEKYYGNSILQQQPLLNPGEIEFIKRKPILKVAYKNQLSSIEYKDRYGEFSGMVEDMLEEISRKVGIEFEYIEVKSTEEAKKLMLKGEVDLIASESSAGNKLSSENIVLTNPYVSLPLIIVGKDEENIKTEDVTIAIPIYMEIGRAAFQDKFEQYNIKYYDNYIECINAVKSGEVDITALDSYTANIAISSIKDNKLRVVDIGNLKYNLSIGVNSNLDPLVISILNKAIDVVDEKTKVDIMMKNVVQESMPLTLNTILVKYKSELIIFIWIVIIISLLTFCYIRQRRIKYYEKMAFTDPLTGLWNANKFKVSAKKILEANKGKSYALIYSDIDKFKFLNDNLGYEEGDKIICALSDELYNSMEKNEIFARVSADNFLTLVEFTNREEFINRLTNFQNIINRIEKVIAKNYRVKVVSGIYIFNSNGIDIEDIINKANMARKSVKGSHTSKIAFYDQCFENKIIEELEIENKMYKALINKEFKVYYQPKYDLKTEKIVGAEALVRWQDSQKGLILPSKFIPLFEKTGFIVNLDMYIYKNVLKTLRERLDEGKSVVPISLNLSRLHVNNPNIIKDIEELVENYNISPELVEFELTESAFMKNTDRLIEKMIDLKKVGFKISVDDFGSGFSSLNLLKEFPANTLKIDKAFLDETTNSKRSKDIIKSIVNMAKNIHMEVICEGVETREQADFLKEIGCEMAQGYLFAKPMPREEFEELLDLNDK
jgi:diguanylate cyclase (GGDEF)-like protein